MKKPTAAQQQLQAIAAAGYRFETYGYVVGSGPRALRQAGLRLIAPSGEVLVEDGTPWTLRRRALEHMAANAEVSR